MLCTALEQIFWVKLTLLEINNVICYFPKSSDHVGVQT